MTINDAIRSLPVDERRVMTLIKVYGYTSAQIAVRLDMPLERVLQIKANAIHHFADALERAPIWQS